MATSRRRGPGQFGSWPRRLGDWSVTKPGVCAVHADAMKQDTPAQTACLGTRLVLGTRSSRKRSVDHAGRCGRDSCVRPKFYTVPRFLSPRRCKFRKLLYLPRNRRTWRRWSTPPRWRRLPRPASSRRVRGAIVRVLLLLLLSFPGLLELCVVGHVADDEGEPQGQRHQEDPDGVTV